MYKKNSRDIKLFIVDLLVGIEKINGYISDFQDKEEFRQDSLHWDATMRQLEIVGEALNRLLEDKAFRELSPDYFRKVVNFRNVIVHGYFGIDLDEVWDVVTNKIDLLKRDIEYIVKKKIDISDAIEAAIVENQNLKDHTIVSFLMRMRKLT